MAGILLLRNVAIIYMIIITIICILRFYSLRRAFYLMVLLLSLFGMSETFLCSTSALEKNFHSTRCASAATIVPRDVDIFSTIASLNSIL
jgi:hypothetical protein